MIYIMIECGLTIEEVGLASNSVSVKISISKFADIDLDFLLVLLFSWTWASNYSILIAVEA